MLVRRSYFSSQSLIRFLRSTSQISSERQEHSAWEMTYFGTATSKVSMNSLFSTRSSRLTTSTSDRCERFPLGEHGDQLRLPNQHKGAHAATSLTPFSVADWSIHLWRGCSSASFASAALLSSSFPARRRVSYASRRQDSPRGMGCTSLARRR